MLYLPWRFQKSRVLHCKLKKDASQTSQTSSLSPLSLLHSIREWVIHQCPSVSTSTRWWFKDLPPDIKDSFYDIAKDKRIIEMFGKGYYIDLLHDMNEVYVSPPSNYNELVNRDFGRRHINGPFFSIPFASCYQIIVGLDDNRNILTVFHLTPESYIIKTGDVVGFDFHRECHYISPILWNESVARHRGHRVILKIHYCVYPYWACVFGFMLSKLSIFYNKVFRDLKLNQQSKRVAKLMIFSTRVYHDIEFYIGNNNIQYASLLLYVASKTHSNVFLFGTSFVHYFRWIDTVKHDSDSVITNPLFKRDYYFFKFLYMLNYFHLYLSYHVDSPVLYTAITVPPLFALYILYTYTAFIPKGIEIYIMCVMLSSTNLLYTEYIYLYINLFLNYVQIYNI
jgi:hypothetical protein